MTRQHGQSIIEVLFVVGIVATLVAAIASLTVLSFKSKTKGEDRSVAVNLGQKILENYTSQASDDPSTFWTYMARGDTQTQFAFLPQGYQAEAVFAQDASNCEAIRCGTIKVTISYSKEAGVTNVTMKKRFTKAVLVPTPSN